VAVVELLQCLQAEVVFLPAQHWSSRTGLDKRRSLWGSYAVITGKQRFWFAGDTGYCPAFTDIGAAYGPFDAAAIPIGAYNPEWFLEHQHVNPEQAVQVRPGLSVRMFEYDCM
jgi:N-acyl-phosphatidylethanolamine-hydrolysing phospholipase D